MNALDFVQLFLNFVMIEVEFLQCTENRFFFLVDELEECFYIFYTLLIFTIEQTGIFVLCFVLLIMLVLFENNLGLDLNLLEVHTLLEQFILTLFDLRMLFGTLLAESAIALARKIAADHRQRKIVLQAALLLELDQHEQTYYNQTSNHPQAGFDIIKELQWDETDKGGAQEEDWEGSRDSWGGCVVLQDRMAEALGEELLGEVNFIQGGNRYIILVSKLYYYSINNPTIMDRRLWTQEEDQHIIRLVAKFGTKKWPLISERLCAETPFDRTGKQCRQRWYNHLNPDITTALWSQDDEERLFLAHKQHGNKWKIISKLFVGRTDNSIKNHFYSTIRRCLRRINKLQGQKNSTLKMRSIKPFVLSKILADRNLTETILELGKIKPNKSRRQFKFEYFQEFNQMINKLYEINAQYQLVKSNKKQLVEKKLKEHGSRSAEEPSISKDDIDSLSDEEDIEDEQPQQCAKKQNRTTLNLLNKDLQQTVKEQKVKKERILSPQRKKRNRTNRAEPCYSYQEYKQIKLADPRQISSSRRARKTINYMKLNEGILCQTQRPHDSIDETHQDSEIIKKKVEFVGSYDHLSLDERLFGEERLSEIMEEEEKQLEKDNGQQSRNLFNPDERDTKALRHFQLSNPSPSYNKSTNFFEDLVVIGTHMKVFNTPRACSAEKLPFDSNLHAQFQRKKSQEQFIQQILEINFDPQFALKYGSEDIEKE